MAKTLQPEHYRYDLDQALSTVVTLRSEIPADALTAPLLGTEREGHGVVIRDSGVVLTIGYLVTEAQSIWLIDNHGVAVSGYPLAHDQETGFGLVQALQPLSVPALPLGHSSELTIGEAVVVAGGGGREQAIAAVVEDRREFAGYWEYLLDEAIFTTPPHLDWGGTALIGEDGTLRGIGSLFVQDADPEHQDPGTNMMVPIDLLYPILDDLLHYGRVQRPARPWLGLLTTEVGEHLVVAGLVPGSPAEQTPVRPGDVILAVGGQSVQNVSSFLRLVWQLGDAGVEVPLRIYREGKQQEVRIPSASRYDCLKAPELH